MERKRKDMDMATDHDTVSPIEHDETANLRLALMERWRESCGRVAERFGRRSDIPFYSSALSALAGECRQRARVEGDVAAASEPLGHAPAGLPPSFHQREPQVRRLIVLDGRHRVVIRSHVHILPFPFHPAPAASLESRLPRIAPAHAR